MELYNFKQILINRNGLQTNKSSDAPDVFDEKSTQNVKANAIREYTIAVKNEEDDINSKYLFGEEPSDETLTNINHNTQDTSTSGIFAKASGAFRNLASNLMQKLKNAIYTFLRRNTPQPPSTDETDDEGGSTVPDDQTQEQEDNNIDPVNDTTRDTQGPTETPEESDIVLSRKTANKQTVTLSDTETKVLKCTNSTDGKEYYYQISANGVASTSATFTYLDNDRLMIQGSNIKIVAYDGQEDNIILLGSNSFIDTNTGNDKVRIGLAQDSAFSASIENYDGNTINTGAGNDYIQNIGQNTIDAGSGHDKFANMKYTQQGINAKKVVGVTETLTYNFTSPSSYTRSYSNTTSDNAVGWASQDKLGDCKLLSTLNSLNKPLSEYVTITKNGSNYEVTFKNYNKKKFTVTSQDLNKTEYTDGDIDVVLTEIAFEKALNELGFNMSEGGNILKSLGSSTNNFLVSKIFFGTKDGGEVNITEEIFNWLYAKYESKELPYLIVNTTQNANDVDNSIGIYQQHAYAVKYAKQGEYVVLANPHDNADTINLDWQDFFKYFATTSLFGENYEQFVAAGYNIDYPSVDTTTNSTTPQPENIIFTYNDKPNLFINVQNQAQKDIEEVEAAIENVQNIIKDEKEKQGFNFLT